MLEMEIKQDKKTQTFPTDLFKMSYCLKSLLCCFLLRPEFAQSTFNTILRPSLITFGSSSGQGCLELLLELFELSIALIRYPDERGQDQAHEGLLGPLDGKRTRIKETEVGIAACQAK